MSTMRAVVSASQGAAPSVIEVEIPHPAADQVRIKVAAAAVNPVDVQTAAGVYHQLGWVSTEGAVGLGWDVAGVVDAVGDGVDAVAVGDRVAALSAGVDRPLATHAEYTVVPAAAVAGIPDGLETAAAATVPLNALTADQALDLLGEPTGTLLVTGAAGGVGGFAIPLALQRGWKVVGLARQSDREFVGRAGGELVDGLDGLATVDAVVDAAVLGEAALAAVRDGGAYVGVNPAAVPDPTRGIRTAAVSVAPDGRRLAELLSGAASGALEIRIAQTLPLSEAATAYQGVAAGGQRGRVVLTP